MDKPQLSTVEYATLVVLIGAGIVLAVFVVGSLAAQQRPRLRVVPGGEPASNGTDSDVSSVRETET